MVVTWSLTSVCYILSQVKAKLKLKMYFIILSLIPMLLIDMSDKRYMLSVTWLTHFVITP